ncbi:nuclear transport factor 2 family protein [Sporosarcina sp. ITBMC105]
MSQKELAVTFLQQIVSGKIKEAFDDAIHTEFIHHNAYFEAGAQSLMKAMMDNAELSPNKQWTVVQVIEEEDRVVIHSHIQQNTEDLGAAVVHIFRFQEGRIIEMWDVGQSVVSNSPNEQGMF